MIQKSAALSDEMRAARALRAHLRSAFEQERDAYIEQRMAWDYVRTKTAAGAFTGADYNNNSSTSAEFMRHLIKQSVVARIAPAALRVELYSPLNDPFNAIASWAPEGHPIPVYSGSLQNHSLDARKVGVITVHTLEALDQKYAEESVLAAQSQACTEAIDTQFLDPDAVGFEGYSPSPITADAEVVESTGEPYSSFRVLLQDFRNLQSSFLIMHPEVAVQLSMTAVNGVHAFPDLGAMGGTLCGLPVLCSQSAPIDTSGATITLLDASRVILSLGGVEISRSEDADIEFAESFDSNGTGERVSLFQADAIAAKTILHANWKLLDSGACRILTGVDW